MLGLLLNSNGGVSKFSKYTSIFLRKKRKEKKKKNCKDLGVGQN
jgi:hypothetical protein